MPQRIEGYVQPEPELFDYLVVDTDCMFWTFSAEDIDHAIEQYDNMEQGKVRAVFRLFGPIMTEKFYMSDWEKNDAI